MSPEPGPVSSGRWPWATLLLALLAIAIDRIPTLPAALILERDAWQAGELWRGLTGHLVHYHSNHLAWNLLVLIPAGCWSERLAPAATATLYVVAALLISVGVMLALPSLQAYAGLSGLAAAVVTFLALVQARRTEGLLRLLWFALVVLLAAKIGWEATRGVTLLATVTTARPVPLAHLIGAVTGGFAARLHWRHQRPDPGRRSGHIRGR